MTSVFCRANIRAKIGGILTVQSVILLAYFGFLQFPHSPTTEQHHGNSTVRIHPSLHTKVLQNQSWRHGSHIEILEIGPVGYSPTVTEDPRSLNLQDSKNVRLQSNPTRNNSLKSDNVAVTIRGGDATLMTKGSSEIPVTPAATIVHTTYSYWLKRLQSSLANNINMSVTHNLAEWFPINQTSPSSITIRGVNSPRDVTWKLYSKSAINSSHLCLKEGLKYGRHRKAASPCSCKREWQGPHCSIPEIVWYSSGASYVGDFTLRSTPRKVINALAFNMEFDLLEARLHELRDVVDLFIVYESNYTLYGDPKPLRLLDRLLNGYLKEFHAKIYYLFHGKFPVEAKQNGWFAEEYERQFIGREGMRHTLGVSPDDLFIYTDADEIPSRDAILFVKTHSGYPEPFGFSLRWSIFGFFWRQRSNTDISAGCSIRMFRYIYSNNAQALRVSEYESVNSDILRTFLSMGGKLQKWTMGDGGAGHGGWHCSWCLSPDGIRVKLTSAVNADFPRWGSFPEKLDLKYIKRLIVNGIWFDDTTRFDSLVTDKTDENFAPKFMMDNWTRFSYVLDKDVAANQ